MVALDGAKRIFSLTTRQQRKKHDNILVKEKIILVRSSINVKEELLLLTEKI